MRGPDQDHRECDSLEGRTDEQLMAALQGGNKDAYTCLIQRYRDIVKGTISNRLPPCLRKDIDDLAQEVFLRLYQVKDRFIKDSFVGAFLLKTTHRTVATFLQNESRKRRDNRRTIHVVNPQSIHDGREDEKTLAAETISGLLEQLTAPEAEVVQLMDLEGHTAMEVSKLLDRPLTTINWRHRKAIQSLRALVTQELADAVA